jgi:hypothetical protein
MKKIKKIPALGAEFCQIFKRKSGAHPHKLTKRNKTRNKQMRIQKILKEY